MSQSKRSIGYYLREGFFHLIGNLVALPALLFLIVAIVANKVGIIVSLVFLVLAILGIVSWWVFVISLGISIFSMIFIMGAKELKKQQ